MKYLHDHQAELGLNPEQAKLLDVHYKQFVHAGAQLPPAKQAQLKVMNKRLSTLQTDFTQKLLAAAKAGALHVDRQGGARRPFATSRSQPRRMRPRRATSPGYVLPLQNTTQQPSLEFADQPCDPPGSCSTRASTAPRKATPTTRARSIREIAQLRAKKAALFGAAELGRLHALRPDGEDPRGGRRLPRSARPRGRGQAADRGRGHPRARRRRRARTSSRPPADWNFYAEQIRKQRYAIDSDQLKQYFEFNKVLEDGVFYAANQLYGLTFKERKDIPTWNPDMRVFEVYRRRRQAAGDVHDRPVEAGQ